MRWSKHLRVKQVQMGKILSVTSYLLLHDGCLASVYGIFASIYAIVLREPVNILEGSL